MLHLHFKLVVYFNMCSQFVFAVDGNRGVTGYGIRLPVGLYNKITPIAGAIGVAEHIMMLFNAAIVLFFQAAFAGTAVHPVWMAGWS